MFRSFVAKVSPPPILTNTEKSKQVGIGLNAVVIRPLLDDRFTTVWGHPLAGSFDENIGIQGQQEVYTYRNFSGPAGSAWSALRAFSRDHAGFLGLTTARFRVGPMRGLSRLFVSQHMAQRGFCLGESHVHPTHFRRIGMGIEQSFGLQMPEPPSELADAGLLPRNLRR